MKCFFSAFRQRLRAGSHHYAAADKHPVGPVGPYGPNKGTPTWIFRAKFRRTILQNVGNLGSKRFRGGRVPGGPPLGRNCRAEQLPLPGPGRKKVNRGPKRNGASKFQRAKKGGKHPGSPYKRSRRFRPPKGVLVSPGHREGGDPQKFWGDPRGGKTPTGGGGRGPHNNTPGGSHQPKKDPRLVKKMCKNPRGVPPRPKKCSGFQENPRPRMDTCNPAGKKGHANRRRGDI